MRDIQIVNREMKAAEFERMKAGFDEHTLENGVQIQSADRFGYVAVEGNEFIGCSSGLAYKNDQQYSGWFYLTDLFVEKGYRSQGWGGKLLRTLEQEIAGLGIAHIWTWTAGYEAPALYQKQGYDIFAEMENWYSDGSSRVGLRKKLETRAVNTL